MNKVLTTILVFGAGFILFTGLVFAEEVDVNCGVNTLSISEGARGAYSCSVPETVACRLAEARVNERLNEVECPSACPIKNDNLRISTSTSCESVYSGLSLYKADCEASVTFRCSEDGPSLSPLESEPGMFFIQGFEEGEEIETETVPPTISEVEIEDVELLREELPEPGLKRWMRGFGGFFRSLMGF